MNTGGTVFRTRFSMEDQHAFARLSGDYNPAHVDPVEARRTVFGGVVVHGVHAALRGFDRWAWDWAEPRALTKVDLRFRGSVPVDAEAVYALGCGSGGEAKVRAEVAGARAFTARFETRHDPDASWPEPLEGFPPASEPARLGPEDIPTCGGSCPLLLDQAALTALLPSAAAKVPCWQLAVLLAATRIAGMQCPGIGAVLNRVQFEFTKDAEPVSELAYEVTGYDERFRMIALDVRGAGVSGSIQVMHGPAPCAAPACGALPPVEAGEFADQHALVVGGSRGLGASVARLLAMGGARVCLTYARNAAAASEVVDDILEHGGQAECRRLDVLERDGPFLTWPPTHLYYFATPNIFEGVAARYSSALAARFRACYVEAFERLVESLAGAGTTELHAFYPSTSAIDEPQPDMAEYIEAKLAGEDLCRQLLSEGRLASVYCPRLPRIATDQTLSLMDVPNAAPGPVMLEQLRTFKRACSGAHGKGGAN